MPDRRTHRGPHPDDIRLFAAEQLPALRAAVRDLSWLLTRFYALPSSLKLVGDRYHLEQRQRTCVSRCACAEQHRVRRILHQLVPSDLHDREVWLDGYNVLTTLEAAYSGGVIIRGCDGCLRDMASMHGSYHAVSETLPAIELLGRLLAEWNVPTCRWLLDQSVSNSGRLRSTILKAAEEHGWIWTVDLVPDPDPLLIQASVCVASADSQILDRTAAWVSLAEAAITQHIPGAWIVDLSAPDGTSAQSS
jgi:hypothetical protein